MKERRLESPRVPLHDSPLEEEGERHVHESDVEPGQAGHALGTLTPQEHHRRDEPVPGEEDEIGLVGPGGGHEGGQHEVHRRHERDADEAEHPHAPDAEQAFPGERALESLGGRAVVGQRTRHRRSTTVVG